MTPVMRADLGPSRVSYWILPDPDYRYVLFKCHYPVSVRVAVMYSPTTDRGISCVFFVNDHHSRDESWMLMLKLLLVRTKKSVSIRIA